MGYYAITCSADRNVKNPITIGIHATSEQDALNQYVVSYLECVPAEHLLIQCKIEHILEDKTIDNRIRSDLLCKLFSNDVHSLGDNDFSSDDDGIHVVV